MCPTTTLIALINCLVTGFFQRGLFPLLISLALIMFLWGVFKFVKDAGDEKARTEGKKLILWGIIGLFMMLCVWAFVEILSGTLGRGGGIFIPQVRI
jgi:succinate-acetate transporter protein